MTKEEIPLSFEELAIGANAMINEEISQERFITSKYPLATDGGVWPPLPATIMLPSLERIINELQSLHSKIDALTTNKQEGN